MKKYLLARWQKRWPIVPAGVGYALIFIYVGGKPFKDLLFFACLIVALLLFPFRFGGEDWSK
jgi:hypothetical protein